MFKLGELNGGYYEYATYSLYAVDVLIIVLLLFVFFNLVKVKSQKPASSADGSKVKSDFLWILIGGLELFIFISIAVAPDKLLALYGYGRFLVGIGLFFAITQIKYDKIKLYWAIVFSGFIQSILAMQQFVSQQVYGNKWLGMASQYSSDLGVSVVDNGFRRWLRVYGSLPHPNILGGFLAIVLLINVILYFNLYKKFKDAINRNQESGIGNQAGLLLGLIFFVINFVGLILTFSRSAWLGFLAGFIILLLLIVKKYGRTGLLNISKFIFIIIALCCLAGYILNEPMKTRLGMDSRLENKSIQERTGYAADAKEVIKNNWLFGVGVKNYGLTVHNQINSERSVYEYEPTHNVFLLVWAETGILGLLAFVILLIYLLSNALKNESYGKTTLIFALTAMMVFDHWWWSLNFGIILFWLVMGMAYKKDNSI
jgi:hypothetical protein